MSQEKPYYATHLAVRRKLSPGDVDMIHYYSQKEIGSDEYYWGQGHTTFTRQEIAALEKDGKLIALPEPQLMEAGHTLWVDDMGNVYYAPHDTPEVSGSKPIFTSKNVFDSLKALSDGKLAWRLRITVDLASQLKEQKEEVAERQKKIVADEQRLYKNMRDFFEEITESHQIAEYVFGPELWHVKYNGVSVALHSGEERSRLPRNEQKLYELLAESVCDLLLCGDAVNTIEIGLRDPDAHFLPRVRVICKTVQAVIPPHVTVSVSTLGVETLISFGIASSEKR